MVQAMGGGLELLEGEPYEDLDRGDIARLGNRGSVVEGRLSVLAARAVENDPHLEAITGHIGGGGTGGTDGKSRWWIPRSQRRSTMSSLRRSWRRWPRLSRIDCNGWNRCARGFVR